MASDASSACWDWRNDDESIDYDNNHEDHSDHPLTIYCGREYNNCNPMDSLQDMQDLAFISGVQQIRNDRWEHTRWIGMLMMFGYNMRAHLKMST